MIAPRTVTDIQIKTKIILSVITTYLQILELTMQVIDVFIYKLMP
jgi:hypothetical protein